MNNNISNISGNQYINNKDNVDQGKQEITNNDLFKDALKDALKTDNSNEMSQSQRTTGSLEELRAAVNITNIEQISNNYSANSVANDTNNLINLLDNYSQNLGNPSKSLKELEPLIDNIQIDAEKLLKEAQEAPLEDTKLKDIATQTAMTANIEFLKFKRGDYL